MILRNNSGQQYSIDFDPNLVRSLGRGGAGTVYLHPADSQQVIKLYHPDFLDSHNYIGQKIIAMLNAPPAGQKIRYADKIYIQIAWPQEIIQDEHGQYIGYSMPLVDMAQSVRIEQILTGPERRRERLPENYLFRIHLAHNLARVINLLHHEGHAFIDLNPNNVRIYRDRGLVCLVDCDGFDISGANGVRYPSELISPDYLYPEAHRKKLNTAQFDKLEQDRFALGILLFQLLNNGLHPYQGRGALVPSSLAERIAEDLYCYGKKPNPRQKPSLQSIHEYLEDSTRELFDQAFSSTNRPSAADWIDHLDSLIHSIQTCNRDHHHHHFSKGCGWCMLNTAVASQIIAPTTPVAELSAPPSSPPQPIIFHDEPRQLIFDPLKGIILLLIFLGCGAALFYFWPQSPPQNPTKIDNPAENPEDNEDPSIIIEDNEFKINSNFGPYGLDFVRIPGGVFVMGCGTWQIGCFKDEKPAHEIKLSTFELSKYEITQGQWRAVMGQNPAHFSSCGENCPVEMVSWKDVQEFIENLNAIGQGAYRLPTEAEWEYACRAGGKDRKYCGEQDINQLSWNSENSGGKTHPIGTKTDNGLGLYDMSGNVWEWVADWYSENYYANSDKENPLGAIGTTKRVIRGGSWYFSAAHVRSTERNCYAPESRYYNLGFRLVRIHP